MTIETEGELKPKATQRLSLRQTFGTSQNDGRSVDSSRAAKLGGHSKGPHPPHAALPPLATEGSRRTATVGVRHASTSAHKRGMPVRSILNNFELRQRVSPVTRARVRSVVERFGEATSRHRPLPDFLILGAQKAGTTALYQSLCRHPRVSAAFTKEVHYFDLQPDRSDRWYRGHFPRRPQRTGSSKRFLTGEATPYYLFHPSVPERVAEKVPHAKLIVLLRDPSAERSRTSTTSSRWAMRVGRCSAPSRRNLTSSRSKPSGSVRDCLLHTNISTTPM